MAEDKNKVGEGQITKFLDGGGDEITLVTYPNGQVTCPSFPNMVDFTALGNMELRDDDVFLCSYPRSGCHWMWEQLRMLLAGTVTSLPVVEKQLTMLENWRPHDFAELPSPRIFNTHVRFSHLPAEVVSRKIKVVMMYRHPKDVAVSLYHLVRHGRWWKYEGEIRNFLQLFIKGQVDGGSMAEYHNDWAKVIRDNPDQPIHIVAYERLKQRPVEELQSLSKFLGKDYDADFLNQVVDACAIDRMRERKSKIWEEAKADKNLMYRNGRVGDWRASFTEEMSQVFDEYWNREFTAGDVFPFQL